MNNKCPQLINNVPPEPSLLPITNMGRKTNHKHMILQENQDVVRFEPADLVHVIEGTVHEVTWSTLLPDVSRVTASVEDQVSVASDASH